MRKIVLLIIIAIAFISMSGCADVAPSWSANNPHFERSEKNLTVVFIDVGQGDSTLIVYNNTATLIDSGPIEEGQTVVSTLQEYGVQHLNYVIVTHEHADHFGGFEYVLKDYPVDTIVYDTCASKMCAVHVTSRIDYAKTQIIRPRAGTILEIDPDIDMRVLSPPEARFSNVNDNSIVIKITYGKTSLLFMGDAEEGAEEYMMDTYSTQELDIDIIKVGHHGSDSSLTQDFLDETTPSEAIISVGEGNSYGHPTQSTLDLLSRNNIKVLRTDKIGNIVFDTDGKIFII